MKLNYYKIERISTTELAMLVLIFDAWLFKLAFDSTPKVGAKKRKDGLVLPSNECEALIGLADLDLEDVEVFMPPPMWGKLKVTKVESAHLGGGDSATGPTRS